MKWTVGVQVNVRGCDTIGDTESVPLRIDCKPRAVVKLCVRRAEVQLPSVQCRGSREEEEEEEGSEAAGRWLTGTDRLQQLSCSGSRTD